MGDTIETEKRESSSSFCNSRMTDRFIQCLPGVNFLGVGFDTSKAGDEDAYRNTEAVIAFKSQKWTQNANILPSKRLFIPNPTEVSWDPRMRDVQSDSAIQLNSAKKLSAGLHSMYGISSNYDVGKSSKIVGKVTSGFSKGEFRLVKVFRIELGRVKLNPSECVVTSSFREAVQKLPNVYDENNSEDWNNFFRQYGTHYIHEYTVGGAIIALKTVDSCTSTSEASAQMSAVLSNGNQTGTASKKQHKEAKNSQTSLLYRGGGINAPDIYKRH